MELCDLHVSIQQVKIPQKTPLEGYGTTEI